MAINRYTFKKEERLCSKRLLEKLFRNGSSFLIYPFRIVYLIEPFSESSPAQVVIGVSKRRFKRAVDRNLIKRRIREVYRLNKEETLYAALRESNTQIVLSLSYVGKEILEYKVFERKLVAALVKVAKEHVKRDS